MGHDRLARWRRRWASSLTWLGLGTVAMGGWTCRMNGIFAVSHGPEQRRWVPLNGTRRMREGPRPALWCAGGNLFLRFRPALTRA
ncbi:hypothetical protein B0H11DRAFT_1983271, partial [Mycena galericulata]